MKDLVKRIRREQATFGVVGTITLPAELHHELVAELERLQRAADQLAYHCAMAVELRTVGSRSGIGDALLDYLEIGSIDGPETVPAWVKQYEADAAKGGG